MSNFVILNTLAITILHVVNKIHRLPFLFFGGILLLGPALYNGFPLVFSDTGMYIKSGMEQFVPPDRPASYGWFIRMLSFLGPWGMPALQAIVLSALLWIAFFRSTENRSKLFFLLFLGMCSLLGAGWYSSQLMPDIWIGIACLSFVFLRAPNQFLQSHLSQSLTVLTLSIALSVHFSHVAILSLVLLLIFFSDLWQRRIKQHRQFHLLSCLAIAAALLLNAFIGMSYGNRFRFATGPNTYYLGWLLDAGVLEQYLEKYKPPPGSIWDIEVSDLPANSRSLLWDPESPVNSHGGWEISASENGRIIRGILKNPQYWPGIIGHAFVSAAGQLLQNDLGSGLKSNWYRRPGSPPYDQIKAHFPYSLRPYLNSRQNGNLWEQELDFTFINYLNRLVMFLAVFVVVISYHHRFRLFISEKSKGLRNIVLLFVFANACICGGLANMYDRLQARISWLLLPVALLLLIDFLRPTINKVLKRIPGRMSA